MDVTAFSDTKLADPDGAYHRLGDLWQERPAVVVFLRHFGCLHCRDHVVDLAAKAEEINAAGGDVVAIGTGDQRYASAFVRDTGVPFLVLVDDDATAARAASVRRVGWGQLLHPRTWPATVDAWKRGARIHKAGKRVNQLGATFVVAPGDRVLYEHIDSDSTDHAPIPDVLAALA